MPRFFIRFFTALTVRRQSIRDPLLADALSRWIVIVAAALSALAWVVILAVPPLPDGVFILHFTTTLGIDAVGSWPDLLRVPLTGTALLAVNIVLARWLVSGERTSGAPTPSIVRLLLAATLLLELGIFVAAIFLWRANTDVL